MKSALSAPCGCYGNRHAFVTNCSLCGRIYCTNEIRSSSLLPSACVFEGCGGTVQMPPSAEEAKAMALPTGLIKALEVKDRLLIFDKENTKRTHVQDMQADYYTTSAWLTEEEKADIERREIERKARNNRRGDRSLNLSLSSGGFEETVHEEVFPDEVTPVEDGINSANRLDQPAPANYGLSSNPLEMEDTKSGYIYRKMIARSIDEGSRQGVQCKAQSRLQSNFDEIV